MSAINFVVDRHSVNESDRDIIRDFWARFKYFGSWEREERKRIYRIAIERHHENQEMYRMFISHDLGDR